MWRFLLGLALGLLVGAGVVPVRKHLREIFHVVAEGVR
jgi:hypothetical protein